MKIKSVFLAVICICLLSAVSFAGTIGFGGASVIPETPAAPKISDAERQTELAMRREKVFAEMKDNSILIMFSTEPRVYTNDVDYVYRQENNLYYLTALNQKNAILVLIKAGGQRNEVLFIPKRNPQTETWNGRMYSNEDAMRLSGIKTVVDAKEWTDFLTAIKQKKSFNSKANNFSLTVSAENLYLLIPKFDFEINDLREYRQEWEFANQFAKVTTDEKTRLVNYEPTLGYDLLNSNPIFTALRSIKSPYEIRLMQHAIDISNEAHLPTREASLNRFQNYLNNSTFIEWDDITPPVIKVSDDATLGFVLVHKKVRLLAKNESGKTEEETEIFAWIETYQKIKGEWKLTAVVSTNTPEKD